MKKSNVIHRLAAAMTVGVMMAQGSEAFAVTDFRNMTAAITNSSSTTPSLINTVSYIGGIGLGVAGIFKLKQHVDNPGQTPMKDGLIRLGAGGGLLALPFMTAAMQNTISGNGTGTAAPAGVMIAAPVAP
jgi:hypothetical protein